MVKSAVMDGLTVREVCVEADTGSGLPVFHMVGYLSSEVKEAGERVRTAIRHTRARLQPQRMVVNLSPADIRKTGASFDLPIAVALALSAGSIMDRCEKRVLFIGELSLDARIRKVRGILPIVSYARENGYEICVVPWENETEGKLVSGIEVVGAATLSEVWNFLETGERPVRRQQAAKVRDRDKSELDFADIKGQSGLKRASEVAAAGGHNILYLGPPGSGKTMAAQRLQTILPDLDARTGMEVTTIYSAAGLLDEAQPLLIRPPYREVHHTVTKAALLGGGRYPTPGELSLAHGGILFLDELSEYQRTVLDALREPLETKQVRITRKKGTYIFPADVLVAAAMNPCPCGNYPDLELPLYTRRDSPVSWQGQPAVFGQDGYLYRDTENILRGADMRKAGRIFRNNPGKSASGQENPEEKVSGKGDVDKQQNGTEGNRGILLFRRKREADD